MIRDLLNRPPHVCVNGHMSEEIVLNSGVPFHPCSFLYTQITLGFKIPEPVFLNLLMTWHLLGCRRQRLLEIGKTKEFVLDAGKTNNTFLSVAVNDKPVETWGFTSTETMKAR